MADHFVDDQVAQARKLGGNQARSVADILEKWDRQQLTLLSKKQMRPVWRERKEIEANLESRKLF